MIYDISFEDSFAEDVSNLALYEVQFTFSVDKAYDRLDAAVDEIEQALRTFPARNPEKPYGFTEALRKMGANIQVYRECLGGTPCRFGQKNYYHSAVISGPTPLHSADIEVPDLRGGFSHLIAALTASGTSTVSGIDVISRGYEHFTRKLHQLDARVRYLDA